MPNSTPDLQSFSPHLFWDVDIKTIRWEEHSVFIVQRVLEYGIMSDWINLYQTIGIQEIGTIAKKIRSLDTKSLVFISALSNIPLTDFLCYTTKQSTPKHWDF
jgi:hypothetical protein